jgi:hypothetical protein
MTHDSIYARVVQRWRGFGLTRRPGVGLNALGAFEERIGSALPPGLRRLLLLSNGMSPEERDPESQVRFWGLEELTFVRSCAPELDFPQYQGVLVFADYSVWAHAYGVALSSGQVMLVGDRTPRPIGDSIEMFLGLYLENAL